MSIEERLERMGCLLFVDNDEYFYYYHYIPFYYYHYIPFEKEETK